MRIIDWIRLFGKATLVLSRHPKFVAATTVMISEGNGAWLGRALRRRLSEEERRRAAVWLLRGSKVRLIVELGGFVWTTDVADEIGIHLCSTGRYEGEELDALLAWLERRRPASAFPTIVDVGANIGTTTLPLAQAGYDIVAIEPVPDTYAMLMTNVANNGFANRVRCVQAAISMAGDSVDMWLTDASGQSEVATGADSDPGFTTWGSEKRRLISVPAARLTPILTGYDVELGEVALVWTDAQGSEADVIETGVELWDRGVPMYLEVWPHGLTMRQGGIDRFISLAGRSFAFFVPRDELLAAREHAVGRPIDRFGDFVASIDSRSYSDALLLPA